MRRSHLFALACLISALLVTPASAGRLDIAIIQFPDARSQDMIATSLAQADLLAITNSDSTETRDAGLMGGRVVFVQSFYTTPGSRFSTSTRLTNQRADVTGSLNGSNLDVEIVIQEGVKVGLRKFTSSTYGASGSIAGGLPVILALQQSTGKTQEVIKGKAKIVSTNFTSLITAQYTP